MQVIPIAMLQSSVMAVMELASFALLAIALMTCDQASRFALLTIGFTLTDGICFLPKIVAIWKTATGILPDLQTNSKNGAGGSGLGDNSASANAGGSRGPLNSLKDFAGTTIR